MNQSNGSAELLPFPIPQDRTERIVLICIRRMAAHGLRDAHAAWLALDTFGVNFRRPLVLLRAFMLELANASLRSIRIAPCCAMRMTEDEAWIMEVIRAAGDDLPTAEQALITLTRNPQMGEPLSAASVFSRSLFETGQTVSA